MRSHIVALCVVASLAFGAVAQAQVVTPGPLRVGAAKVDITPAPGALPRHYLGVLDPVYSRAIVIDNGTTSAALVTVDVISLPDAVADRVNNRIASELGIPVGNIVLAGTGTHSSPTSSGPPPPGAPPVRNTVLEDKIVASVTQAKAKLQPARLRYGTSVSHINVKYIEDSYDDTVVALLSLGAHGDQNPIYFQQTYDLREIRINDYAKRGEDIRNAMPPPGGVGLDRNNPRVAKLLNQQKRMVLTLGQMLGEAVLHAMRSTSDARDLTTIGIQANHKTVTCPGRKRTDTGRSGVAGTYIDADPVEIRLGALVLGDVAIGQINAGPYAAIGLRLKRESPYARTMLTTAANGMLRGGYIPDDASYSHQIFSVLNSTIKPGCAETAIVNGILDLLPPLVR